MSKIIVSKSDTAITLRSPGPQGPQGATGNVLEGIGTDETVMIADSGEPEGIRWAQVGDANVSALSPSKVTGTALVASTVDAKGDLLAATGADAVGRLPVGADGELLVADSGEASGIGWKSLAEADVARASQVGNLLTDSAANCSEPLAWPPSTGAGSTTVSSEQTFDGDPVLKVTPNATQTASQVLFPTTSTYVNGEPYTAKGYERLVTMDVWVWCDGSTHQYIALRTGSANWANVPANPGWNRIVGTRKIPVGEVLTAAYLRVQGTGTDHAPWYFARAALYEGAPSDSWTLDGVPVKTAQQPLLQVQDVASSFSVNRAQPVIVNRQNTNVTYTLPLSSDNYGVKFTIMNEGTATVTLGRGSGDLINGVASSMNIPGKGQLEIISTGSSWNVLSGRYSTNSVGLASYEWDHANNAWRLIAYDTGWRDVSSLLVNGWAQQFGNGFAIRRSSNRVELYGYLNGSAATAGTICMIPTGFTPRALQTAVRTWASNTGSVSGIVRVETNDMSIILYGSYVGTGRLFNMSWTTEQALPTSLPGTQVTAPV